MLGEMAAQISVIRTYRRFAAYSPCQNDLGSGWSFVRRGAVGHSRRKVEVLKIVPFYCAKHSALPIQDQKFHFADEVSASGSASGRNAWVHSLSWTAVVQTKADLGGS